MFRFGKKKRQAPQQQQQQQQQQLLQPQQQQQQNLGPRASQGSQSHSSNSLDQDPVSTSPTPSGADLLAVRSNTDLHSTSADGEASIRSSVSSGSVKRAVKRIEERSMSRSPEKRLSPSKSGGGLSSSSTPSHVSDSGRGKWTNSSIERQYSGNSFLNRPSSGNLGSPVTSTTSVMKIFSIESIRLEVGKEKVYEGVDLRLPPLKTSSVRHRRVLAVKNMALGGFGFILRKSFQPDPENQDKPLLVHLVEPRPNYVGPLMTGDRIIEVNGENVENVPHERVVELIKASGDSVQMVVVSVPELMELNVRGALDEVETHRHGYLSASGSGNKMKGKQGTGTLRKQSATRQTSGYYQAKSEDQVKSEKMAFNENMVWVVHKNGFALASVVKKDSQPKNVLDVNFSLTHARDTMKVKLVESKEFLQVDEVDLEKANPPSLDHVEDIIDLIHLNESSVIHVLRQRYASSLIHTFSGRHMIIINPLRHLSLYSDRVVDMFRGCRREDMPPHIFAMGQQAYRNMLASNTDQSLILMGLSGSGKTFNARYLLRYLASIGQTEGGCVTNAKMDAVDMLLHSFSSAATVLNPQATRCSCLYSLEYDPSGSLSSACVRTFVLERSRVAIRPEGEQSFNILYYLIAGADEQLRSELLLNTSPGTTEPNPYVKPHSEEQQTESSAYAWDLIQNCLHILGISGEEALGLWSLLAAIFHLGNAGVSQTSGRGSERFSNPAAAQRAASLLGINQEELAKDIFNPPRVSTRYGSTLSQSPSMSETSSINMSINSVNMSPGSILTRCTLSLDAFVMGLYEQAFNALVALVNRSLHSTAQAKGRYLVHILDTPGFQQRDLAGVSQGASLDDLCFNYAQERLQMLYHDTTFTADQERYLQENIQWAFDEVVFSPLAVIDVIDKHVPQRRGTESGDRRGLLWLLDEECVSGSSDYAFLEKVQTIHGEPNEFDEMLVQVIHEKNQFIISHCQQSLPIAYEVTGWLRRAREHPSTRVVFQVLSESKRPCIAALFQGRGVASSSGAASIMNKTDSQTTLRMARALSLSSNPTAGVKKASICLQTKFQLDFLMDMLRKTDQWFVRCILPEYPSHLPGSISPSSSSDSKLDQAPRHGHMDVPLVRAQLRRADIVPGARIYKQGFPEHLPYPAFKRRYMALLSPEERFSLPDEDKIATEFIISGLEDLDRSMYRLGLSQVFFHAGTLSRLDRKVEAQMHDVLVKFQAHCRGYLGRQLRETLDLQHAATRLIQRNIRQSEIINNWAWWKLFRKVKPLLAVWKAEEEVKEKDSQIDTLKGKLTKLEEEVNALKESENRLMDRVSQLTTELQESQLTAEHATELLEQEQVEKRELEEQWQGMNGSELQLLKQNEELQMQVAELSILARIKQSEGSEAGSGAQDSEAVLEKYWETKRELETLRQHLSTDYEDKAERLNTAKKNLEKKLLDAESEVEDLRRNLAQSRKKAAKYSSEMNDLKLQLESQQARNEELERRQRKFDTDLSSAHSTADVEKKAKDQLQREKEMLQLENSSLEQQLAKLKEDYHRLENEKIQMEADFIQRGSSDAESEIASLKRMKKELERKVEEVEDDLYEANIKLDSLMQAKTRLDLAIQSSKTQHTKELESRDEDMAQLRTSMTKKLKALEQQLEEEHELKQQAIKARRELERQLTDMQSRNQGDPEVEKKLKKQVKKYKALLVDAQEELQHERENRSSAATIRSLRTQLEDMEVKDAQSVKLQKRLQAEMEEMQAQLDELTRGKLQLEAQVTDLHHVKSDLEARLEEEQDEVEELTGRQRQHISQIATIQQQLTESSYEIEELQDAKQASEQKLKELRQKIAELESGVNKQEYEASELKVRELEQKLDLEKSTNKRQENLIARLRNQLERLQEDKADTASSHSNEAIRRLQRQMRDLREELQESERKEQELNKKRRAADTQVMEMQAQLTTTQSDLKSAQKRIESLQKALEGQDEEFSSEGEDETRPTKRKPAKKAASSKRHSFSDASSGGSYHIGEFGTSGTSDEEMAKLRSRRKFRSSMRIGSSGLVGDNNSDVGSGQELHTGHRHSLDVIDVEDDQYKPNRRKIYDSSDDDLTADRTSRKKTVELSDEEAPRKGKKIDWRALFSDEDKDDKQDHGGSRRNDKVSDEDTARPNWRKKYDISSDDDGVEVKSLSRSTWRAKYNISSDDEDNAKGSPRRTSGSTKRSQQSLASDDSDDLGVSLMRKKRTASQEDIGGKDVATKTSRTRKAWETSSEDEDIVGRRRERSVPLDSDDDLSLRTRRSREILDELSDGVDLPSQPVRKKISFDLKEANPEMFAGTETHPKPSEEASEVSTTDKADNASFVASRKRRQRRRSRLSNTDTSPKKTLD